MKLRILDDIIAMIARAHRLCRLVARHDSGLARQMREASTSVGLNAHGKGSTLAVATAPRASRSP